MKDPDIILCRILIGFADVIVYIFSSIAYDLNHRSGGRIYKLNAKVERPDKPEFFTHLIGESICAIFSSLQAVLKEITAIKNCEIAGWQKS